MINEKIVFTFILPVRITKVIYSFKKLKPDDSNFTTLTKEKKLNQGLFLHCSKSICREIVMKMKNINKNI